MRIHRLTREQLVAAKLDAVFEFFALAHNLERITPPWLSFEILTPGTVEMRVGTVIDYRLRLHGLPLRWRSQIDLWEPQRAFVDRQLTGPYRLWHHRHEFEPRGSATLVRDIVHYALPFGLLGEIALPVVRRDLERIFDYRRTATEDLVGGTGAGLGAVIDRNHEHGPVGRAGLDEA